MALEKTAAFIALGKPVRCAKEQEHARFVTAEDGKKAVFWPGWIA
jgi:hypothetical protein